MRTDAALRELDSLVGATYSGVLKARAPSHRTELPAPVARRGSAKPALDAGRTLEVSTSEAAEVVRTPSRAIVELPAEVQPYAAPRVLNTRRAGDASRAPPGGHWGGPLPLLAPPNRATRPLQGVY